MKIKVYKLIVTMIALNLLLTGASGQEYIDSDELYYSDKLKAGMEFTWEIVRFNFNFNYTDESLELDQASTTVPPATSIVLDETTTVYSTVSDETTTVYVTETTEYDEGSDFPEIKPGTKYTVKLLQDLGGLSEDRFWDDYENQDDYFDYSFSDPDIDTSEEDFGPSGFILPNTIRFENGTVLNYFEYQVDQFSNFEEEYPDDLQFVYKIEDKMFIEETHLDSDEGSIHQQMYTDVETGVLVYISLFQNSTEANIDVEVKLEQSSGIDIDTVIANDDPTLSVPFSAIFVYTLILTPVVVSRFRKKS